MLYLIFLIIRAFSELKALPYMSKYTHTMSCIRNQIDIDAYNVTWWSTEAKVGKCETEIQAKIGSKKTNKYIRK